MLVALKLASLDVVVAAAVVILSSMLDAVGLLRAAAAGVGFHRDADSSIISRVRIRCSNDLVGILQLSTMMA